MMDDTIRLSNIAAVQGKSNNLLIVSRFAPAPPY